ncbi:MAG: sugar transferase [Verrucomicrobiales bacterium]|nr:sugar transferase [Verrucomicrobiales bacterium]
MKSTNSIITVPNEPAVGPKEPAAIGSTDSGCTERHYAVGHGQHRALIPLNAALPAPRSRPISPSDSVGSSNTVSPAGLGYPAVTATPGWKRGLDLALMLVLIPIAGPILGLAALWVALVSRGSLLFVQPRVGQGGRIFKCYKLRTMRKGCTVATHQQHLQQLLKEDRPMQKMDTHDPRLIPGARLLRALGIDELPQLINVVRGDMSVVGPRPCIPYEAEQYQPWQRQRFATLPGITGLWQVRGKNRTTFTRMIELDIEYAQTQSMGLDLWILLATPKAIFDQFLHVVARKAQRSKDSSLRERAPVPMTTAGESSVVG